MSSELQQIVLEGFAGGLNTSVDATALKPDELAEALNVRILDNGEVQRRTGYDQWSHGVDSDVHHVTLWTDPSGIDEVIAVDLAGHFFVAESTPEFTSRGTIGASAAGDLVKYPVGFAASEDLLYVSSLRHQRVYKWGGTSLSEVDTAYVPPTPGDGEIEDTNVYVVMPAGQHLVYRHGRMYVGHTFENPSRIWFSHVMDPERFDEEGWIDLDPDDGTTITAMVNYADELFIFKDNSMWELTGRDPTTYTLRAVDRLRGTVSAKTVCQMRGMLVFFDRDSGVWGYDGSQLTLLSEKITHVLLGRLAYGSANRAAMYFGDDRLYLSVPAEDGGYATFVMNAQNGAWSMYDTGFHVGMYRMNERIQAIEGHVGLAIADPDLDLVLGDSYTSKIRTAWLLPAGFGATSRLKRVEGIAEARQWTRINIEVFHEMRSDVVVDSRGILVRPSPMTQYATSDTVTHQFAVDGWKGRFHSIQLGVELAGEPTQLNRLSLFVRSRADVRGNM